MKPKTEPKTDGYLMANVATLCNMTMTQLKTRIVAGEISAPDMGLGPDGQRPCYSPVLFEQIKAGLGIE